jgi:hypothetical protein
MEVTQKEIEAAALAVGRLVWHKPAVRRLCVSLDTKNGLGSFTDFQGGYTTSPISIT